MKTAEKIEINDPRITQFLAGWHEAGRPHFERYYSSLNYDTYEPKTAKDRRAYIALDRGTSGAYLIEKATGLIRPIEAYGRPNKRYCLGHIDDIIAKGTYPAR